MFNYKNPVTGRLSGLDDDDIFGDLRRTLNPGVLRENRRVEELGKAHIDGGGLTPGNNGKDEPAEEPGEAAVPEPQRNPAPAGNSENTTGSENQPTAQQPTDPATEKQISKRELIVVNKPFVNLLLGRLWVPGGEVGNQFGSLMAASAVPYVLLDKESVTAASIAAAAVWAPKFFELHAGSLADRADRKKIMVVSQSVGALPRPLLPAWSCSTCPISDSH